MSPNACGSALAMFFQLPLVLNATVNARVQLAHTPGKSFRQTFRLLFSQNPMAPQGRALPSPSIPAPRPPESPLASGLTPALGRPLSQHRMYLFSCSLGRSSTR